MENTESVFNDLNGELDAKRRRSLSGDEGIW